MEVLVISSQPDFLKEGLKTLVENGLVLHVYISIREAEAAAEALSPDLVMLDASTAGSSLPGACQTLYEASRAPVIVFTEEELSEVEAAACFDAGAGARLLKRVSPPLLLAWVLALTRR
ncbi:MAG: hypothetical protein HYX93_03140 [Chloroflexi bacterium]|nr:hypothetical protein [Chloroflexota bacterium]